MYIFKPIYFNYIIKYIFRRSYYIKNEINIEDLFSYICKNPNLKEFKR